MKPFLTSAFLLLVISAPLLVFAHDISIPYWGDGDNPIMSCTGQYLAPNVPAEKKCRSLCDIIHTLQHAIYFGITLALFVLAPIMFIIGGIMVVIGGANPSIISRGKSILWGTFWGVVIALSSFLIVATFLWLVGNPASGGVHWPQIKCANPPGYQINPNKFQSGFPQTPGPSFATSTQNCVPRCVYPQTCQRFRDTYQCLPDPHLK